jgi:putative transposase
MLYRKSLMPYGKLDKLPKKSQLHQMFYPLLRSYGFRAHVARNMYNYALALVELVRSNGGRKPRN